MEHANIICLQQMTIIMARTGLMEYVQKLRRAENERRKREAEEMGRRQAENILRDRQDIMTKELQEVNQATMDS